MSFLFLFFVGIAILLMGLLLWAVRPVKIKFNSPDEVFEALSSPHPYYELPLILQILRAEDTEFMAQRGYGELCKGIRNERKAMALQYLQLIETDYRTLLEASRVLAAMAAEVVAWQEWERVRLNVSFSWKCKMLRWRLRTGLTPWASFTKISDMASELSFRLEQATTRIGERAVLASEFPSLLEE